MTTINKQQSEIIQEMLNATVNEIRKAKADLIMLTGAIRKADLEAYVITRDDCVNDFATNHLTFFSRYENRTGDLVQSNPLLASFFKLEEAEKIAVQVEEDIADRFTEDDLKSFKLPPISFDQVKNVISRAIEETKQRIKDGIDSLSYVADLGKVEVDLNELIALTDIKVLTEIKDGDKRDKSRYSFHVNTGKPYPSVCRLFWASDSKRHFALSSGVMVCANYSHADIQETKRLRYQAPLNDGEIVLIDNERYQIHVNGDYSDCATFTKL